MVLALREDSSKYIHTLGRGDGKAIGRNPADLLCNASSQGARVSQTTAERLFIILCRNRDAGVDVAACLAAFIHTDIDRRKMLTYATWIFAGLFLLFGMPMLMTENSAWRQFWAGLATLSLGGFALSMVRDALATGQFRLRHSVIRYADQPWLFWAAVIFIAAAGAGTLIAGVWLLFFKR